MDADGVVTFEPETNFRAALQAPDSTAWFGTSAGFRQWSAGELTSYGSAVVYPALVAEDETLWAGSGSDGVFLYGDGAWQPMPVPPELAGVEVFDLAQDATGTIWVATANGVWTVESGGAF